MSTPHFLMLSMLATAALGEDGWSAGAGLMSRADPAQWRVINESLLRSEAASDELKTCYEAAKKTGKEERFYIVAGASAILWAGSLRGCLMRSARQGRKLTPRQSRSSGAPDEHSP